MKKELEIVAPGYHVPHRKKLAGSLLDLEFEDVQKMVSRLIHEHTSSTGAGVFVSTDGWSDIHQMSIINYMVLTPHSTPIFYESKCTGSKKRTANYLEKDLGGFIQEIEQNHNVKVSGAISDNAANIKGALCNLQQQYPTKLFIHCLAHGIHLVVKDIVESDSYFQKIIAATKFIVKFFKYQHILNSNIRSKIAEVNRTRFADSKIPMLQLNVRFQSIH